MPLVIFTFLLATEMLASRKDHVKEVRLPESTYKALSQQEAAD
jgi:hypothetical protein